MLLKRNFPFPTLGIISVPKFCIPGLMNFYQEMREASYLNGGHGEKEDIQTFQLSLARESFSQEEAGLYGRTNNP